MSLSYLPSRTFMFSQQVLWKVYRYNDCWIRVYNWFHASHSPPLPTPSSCLAWTTKGDRTHLCNLWISLELCYWWHLDHFPAFEMVFDALHVIHEVEKLIFGEVFHEKIVWRRMDPIGVYFSQWSHLFLLIQLLCLSLY